MHPVMAIEELREKIVEGLEGHHTSLFSLSLTCKTVSELSLNLLWKGANLGYLVRVFPAGIQASFRDVPHNHIHQEDFALPCRELSDFELERVRFYTKRIRHLNFITNSDALVLRTLVKFHALERLSGVLIPALSSLFIQTAWNVTPHDLMTPLLRLADISKIVKFTLYCPTATVLQSTVESILLNVQFNCRNIQDLVLTYSEEKRGTIQDDQAFDPIINGLIDGLHDLRCLEVGEYLPYPDTFAHLSRLPLLTKLGNLQLTEETASLIGTLTPDTFQNLSTLSMIILHWPSAFALIKLLGPRLYSLDIQSPYSADPGETVLASVISILSNSGDLTELTLDLEVQWNTDAHGVFDPLLSLSKIQKLTIKCSVLKDIDNEWIDCLSRAFPSLSYLSITGYAPGLNPALSASRATLEGLVPLLQRCRVLRTLVISVKCCSFDADGLDQRFLSRISDVTFFNCPVPATDNATDVLKCILALFPHASRISGRCFWIPSSSPIAKRWRELNRLLREALQVR